MNFNELTIKDMGIIEELINQEMISHLDSGYSINDEYFIDLRNLLKKLNLKEKCNFDLWNDKGE